MTTSQLLDVTARTRSSNVEQVRVTSAELCHESFLNAAITARMIVASWSSGFSLTPQTPQCILSRAESMVVATLATVFKRKHWVELEPVSAKKRRKELSACKKRNKPEKSGSARQAEKLHSGAI